MKTLESSFCECLVICCWLLSKIQHSSGWVSGLSGASSSRACSNSSECMESMGEVCFQLYEGCPKAQCMCRRHSKLIPTDDVNAKCVPISVGLGQCSSRETTCAAEGMVCRGGLCRCVSGRLSPDRLQCLQQNARLIGEKCSPKEHNCYQKSASGYTTGDVTCSPAAGICACTEGHRTDDLSCRRRRVHEYGCKKSFHCEGGAVCSNGQCVCPVGYVASGARFKCIRNGATTNLLLGSECDEINERLYCDGDLVCHRCSSLQTYHCVRFVLANDFSRFGTSFSSSSASASFLRTISSFISSNFSISAIVSTSLLINSVFAAR